MTLDRAINICHETTLNLNQVAFMTYVKEGNPESFPKMLALDKRDYNKLRIKGYLGDNMDVKPLWDEIVEGSPKAKTIKIRMDPDVIGVIIERIGKVLVPESFTVTTQSKIDHEFRENEGLKALFCIWYCMFPTTGDSNKGWNKLFGIEYRSSVRLRAFSSTYSTFFKRIARKSDKDIGLLIIGTYLFVKSYIIEGKTYIPKITRFIDTWEQFYDEAVEETENKSLEEVILLFMPSAHAKPKEVYDPSRIVRHVGLNVH
jgi:hypothetical protein